MIKILSSILLLASLFQGIYVSAQGDSFNELINADFPRTSPQDNSVRDSLVQWQERIAIQLDKNAVMPKDILFFKAYVLTGPKQLRVSASEVLKVELLDDTGELIKTQNHKINAGQAYGSFEIPRKLKPGAYFLRAYTQWMLNYGTEQLAVHKIRVGDFDAKLAGHKMEFYPEGGALIAGLENRLIMRIEEPPTNDLRIVNAQNRSVSSVVKYDKNVYSALFRPEKGSRYFLQFNDNVKYQLPPSQDSGYALQVNNIEEDFFDLRIQASTEIQKQKLYVIGESNGVQYLNTEVDFKDGPSIDLHIPKSGLPNGIFELALVNELNQVEAERKLQIGDPELQITIEPIENEPHEEFKSFSVKVVDDYGKPVPTELSVSLMGERTVPETYKYKIQDKDYIHSRKDRFKDDLLLLTRQLPVQLGKTRAKDFPDEIYYGFQNGLDFYGQAYDLDYKLVVNSKVQILIKTEEGNIVREVQTDSNGMLKLLGLQLDGEATMVFRKIAEDTKSKLVRVNPYKFEIPPLKTPYDESGMNFSTLKQLNPRIPQTPKKRVESLKKEEGTIILDGVTLVEEKDKKITIPPVYGIEPTRKVYQDPERPKTIPQLFIGIPGFQVSGMGGLNPTLAIPRSLGIGPVLWVIDGFPLDQGNSSLRKVMNLLSYIDVERIEILSGPNAAIYGSRASGGVISIYTRSGNTDEYYARKDAQTTFQGYHKSLDFNEYQESFNKNKKKNQPSSTIYWNPSLKTDENGEAIIRVKVPSEAMKIKFEALTITAEGRTGKLIRFF